VSIRPDYRGSGKLEHQVALITGGDSGIGRAVAIHFAREGADVALVYLDEHEDALETARLVEQEGQRCLLLSGDAAQSEFCRSVVEQTVEAFSRLDVLVNNAAQQFPTSDIQDILPSQLEHIFSVNVFAYFYMLQACLPHLGEGSSVINSTSVTAFRGSAHLVDYSATKGAIVAFTRSTAKVLVERGIRVNAVAPGPIWTPLIPATFSAEKVDSFGENTPMGRAGQPAEVAPAYVFLACADSSYITGQVIHPNGGDTME
jgi:NAD(P)-dependent dehydrogenase (short-subunit alcohol dehydrogenase family)